MLNMIKLDWLGMKTYQLRGIFIPIMICVFGLVSELMIIPLSAIYMLIFSINPFAVEEKGKLDNLYLTLPVRRKSIVRARYCLSFIMQFSGIAFGAVATVIMSTLFYGRTILYTRTFQPDFTLILLLICGSLFINAIMALAMFPLLFKLGYAKGKVFGFFIPTFGGFALAYGVSLLIIYNQTLNSWAHAAFAWMTANILWSALIILAAAALIYLLAYALSQKVYAKREF